MKSLGAGDNSACVCVSVCVCSWARVGMHLHKRVRVCALVCARGQEGETDGKGRRSFGWGLQREALGSDPSLSAP